MFNKVVLPEPEAPMIATNSPEVTLKLMPFKAWYCFSLFSVSLGDIVHHKNFIHFKNLIFLLFVLLYYTINTVIWYYNFVNLFLAQKKLSHFLTSGKAYNIKL